MAKNFNDFSSLDLAALLRQPQTRALLARLQQMDGAAVEQAARCAAGGDTESARALLQPMLSDSQVQELTRSLQEDYGGI